MCSKALAAATGAAVFVSAYAPTLASAAEPEEYISEVFLSYGKTDEEAKDWLEKNGYTVLDQNLNEGAAGGISWLGINFSEKRSVYLGYKTTTDVYDAIRDMRAMNMNGSYSYDEYEKVLETKKSEINAFLAGVKSALEEYRRNYKNGTVKAKIAHDKMNQLYDDDCNYSCLGDLLLQPIKEEMTEEAYKAAEEEHVDMTTLLMQGNIVLVNSLMSYLSMAADTAENSWLDRYKNSGGIDALYKRYEDEYPALSESQIDSLIRSDYDEQAKRLTEKLFDLNNFLKIYTESSIKADSSDKEVEEYFNQHPDVSTSDWSMACTEYLVLSETKVSDTTLADILNDIINNYDDPDTRMELYPLLDAMSSSQRELLAYVDLGEMLITGSLDTEGWKKIAEETENDLKDSLPSSIYSGVDRSMFDPAGIALTSEARKIQSATGSAYTANLLGIDTAYLKYASLGTAVALLGAGVASFVHMNGLQKAAFEAQRSVQNAKKLIDNMNNAKTNAAKAFFKELQEGGIIKIDTFTIEENLSGISERYLNQVYDYVRDNPDKNIKIVREFGGDPESRTGKTFLDIARESGNDEYLEAEKTFNRLENSVKESDAVAKSNMPDNVSGNFVPWKVAGVALCIAAAIFAVGAAAIEIYELYKYYNSDYAPIPRKIIHESTDELGRFVYTAYDCTLCNREAQGFGKADLEAYGDMNGDVGKQWLALYTTKEKAAGDPVTADIITQKGSNKFPADKSTTVRLFGQNDSVNIVSTDYGYNDSLNGLYIFTGTAKADEKPSEQPSAAPESSSAETSSETESVPDTASEAESEAQEEESTSETEAPAAGSVVGTGVMIGSCAGSAVLGALVCFLIARRKRKPE